MQMAIRIRSIGTLRRPPAERRGRLAPLNEYGVIALVVVGAMWSPPALHAQGRTAASGVKAEIGIRAIATWTNGRGGGTSVSDDLRPGESVTLHLSAGNGGDPCFSSVWASRPGVTPSPEHQAFTAEQEANALYVWRFTVSAVEVITDKITFDLAWQRTSPAGAAPPLSQKRRVTFREGEASPIDLIHGDPDSDCTSLVVEATAGIIEDPAVAPRTVEWDVWFSGGREARTAHQTLTSAHGEAVFFRLDAVPSTATQLNGQADDVWVEVYGQVRGRMRPDGQLDVAVNTQRRSGGGGQVSPTSSPKKLASAGGSGQKNFTIRPGETVKIVLPPLGGTAPQSGGQTSQAGRRAATPGMPPTRNPSATEMSLTIRARVR
jgi:hypothetical protein